MSLHAHQHELLSLYAQYGGPVSSEVFRSPPPPGGEGDPEWDRWRHWQDKLNSAVFSLYSAGLIAVVGDHVEGQPDIVEVTEAGHAALADPSLTVLDPDVNSEVDRAIAQITSSQEAEDFDTYTRVWDLLDSVAEARGWSCRAQPFGPGAARLLVTEEQRWVGLSISPSRHEPLAHVTAGRITPAGQNTSPLVHQAVHDFLTLELVLREVEHLWRRLDQTPDLHK